MKIFARTILVAIIILFSLSRIKSILISGNSFLKTLDPIFNKPFATYDEKMAMKYPVYHNFIQDIKKATPKDSIIYLPKIKIARPKPMWVMGSIQITQPLLYPREVRKLDLDNLPIKKDDNKNTYIVVVYGYPNIPLPNSELIFLVDDNNIMPNEYESSVFKENNIAGLVLIK